MPKSKYLPVADLSLDLRNYRTTPQPDELSSLRTIISINQNRFWGVMESLLEEGYSPIDNILVLDEGAGKMIVREGNRRIGALKLMLGQLNIDELTVPGNILTAVAALDDTWKKENVSVPCAIFGMKEVDHLSKIVARIHGRAEKSSRLPWTAVSKARHDRDESKMSVPHLDLLEKYIATSNNLSGREKEEWSGDYNLTVLHAVLQKHIVRLGFETSKELADKYPKIPLRIPLENLLYAIGKGGYGFEELRHPTGDPLFTSYEIPPLPIVPVTVPPANGGKTAGKTATPTTPPPVTTTPSKAIPLEDPKSIIKALKGLSVRGDARDKVATLVVEATLLKVGQTPLAFCFVLRSMFEISAAAYCAENKGKGGVETLDKNGKPKNLGKLLVAISKHYVENSAEKEVAKKFLHGAGSVLGNPTSILSVTSLNNLVHSPTFAGKPAEISVDFHKLLPLLKVMNNP